MDTRWERVDDRESEEATNPNDSAVTAESGLSREELIQLRHAENEERKRKVREEQEKRHQELEEQYRIQAEKANEEAALIFEEQERKDKEVLSRAKKEFAVRVTKEVQDGKKVESQVILEEEEQQLEKKQENFRKMLEEVEELEKKAKK